MPLDACALVLPRAPDVREEEVPLVALGERQLGPVAGGDEAERGDLGRLVDGLDREYHGEDKGDEDAGEEAATD